MSEAILLLALVTVLVIVAKSYSTAQNDSGPPCQTTRSLSARRWNEKKRPQRAQIIEKAMSSKIVT